MKKLVFIILIASIFFLSCKHKQNTDTDQSEIMNASTSSSNFYKRFEGTIARKPVVMQIHKNGDKMEAVYYYKNTGGWLTLRADKVIADSIFFSEYDAVYNQNNDTDSDTLHPQLRCSLKNDLLTGVWLSRNKKIFYPIDLKEVYPKGSYQFLYSGYTDSLKAFADKQQSPMASIDNSFVVAQNNAWLNNEIKKILNFDSSINFEEGFSKAKTQYFDDYKKELPASYDSLDMPETFNYAQSQNLYTRFNGNDFVILELEDYMYSGGAHGNYGSSFYCFDVARKKQMLLSDILLADSVTLQHVVEKYFRIQYKVKSDSLNEVLFDNHLAANQNFYFNEKEISFLYNPYEVASYAQGQIGVTIPFSALKQFLNPSFKKRMNINF